MPAFSTFRNDVESWCWEKHEHTAPFRLLYSLAFPNGRSVVLRNSESALKERDIARCHRGQVGNRFRLASNPPSEKLRFSKDEHVMEGRRAIERDFCSKQLPRSHAHRENTVPTLYQSPSSVIYMSLVENIVTNASHITFYMKYYIDKILSVNKHVCR